MIYNNVFHVTFCSILLNDKENETETNISMILYIKVKIFIVGNSMYNKICNWYNELENCELWMPFELFPLLKFQFLLFEPKNILAKAERMCQFNSNREWTSKYEECSLLLQIIIIITCKDWFQCFRFSCEKKWNDIKTEFLP